MLCRGQNSLVKDNMPENHPQFLLPYCLSAITKRKHYVKEESDILVFTSAKTEDWNLATFRFKYWGSESESKAMLNEDLTQV